MSLQKNDLVGFYAAQRQVSWLIVSGARGFLGVGTCIAIQ